MEAQRGGVNVSPSRFTGSVVGRFASGVVAFILAFTTSLSSVSVAYASETVSSPQSPTVEQVVPAAPTEPIPVSPLAKTPAAKPTVVRELANKRTERKREFLLSDGRIRAVYYGEPIYYRDSAGTLRPVDTALENVTVSDREVASNRGASFDLQLPDELSREGVSLSKDGLRIEITPASREATAAARASADIAASETSGNVRAYARAFGDADLVYESRADGLKESIILAGPTASSIFSFDLSLTGLTPRAESDGSISLLTDAGVVFMVIPRPAMWDSAPQGSLDFYSDKVHYTVSGKARPTGWMSWRTPRGSPIPLASSPSRSTPRW